MENISRQAVIPNCRRTITCSSWQTAKRPSIKYTPGLIKPACSSYSVINSNFGLLNISFTFYIEIVIKCYICFTINIEMAKDFLGEFEELVLTMVGILGEDAYGNAIVNEIKDRVGRDTNLSAVHVTLYRLE